jgi:hypothetical protein
VTGLLQRVSLMSESLAGEKRAKNDLIAEISRLKQGIRERSALESIKNWASDKLRAREFFYFYFLFDKFIHTSIPSHPIHTLNIFGFQ